MHCTLIDMHYVKFNVNVRELIAKEHFMHNNFVKTQQGIFSSGTKMGEMFKCNGAEQNPSFYPSVAHCQAKQSR